MKSVDIRQSDMFACYLERIGWTIETIGDAKVFIRRFPVLGSLIKIQRVDDSLSLAKVEQLAKKYRAFRIILELNQESRIKNQELIRYGFRGSKNPHAPSKSIEIDLTSSEETIFKRFVEAKRRGVRRALKHEIVVQESSDIDAFIKLKWGNDPFFFWLVKGNQKKLWQAFSPKNAIVLFAHKNSQPIAGILLLIYDYVAYYWQAAATKEGKRLFAPTLLVWEALKLCKKRGCRLFDFEGIFDERFPSKTAEKWKGFTKFKQGFGGNEIYYPAPWIWSRF